MDIDRAVVRNGVVGDFDRAFYDFFKLYREAQERVGFFDGSSGGEVVSVGDNTSSRFLNLAETLETMYEEALDASEKIGNANLQARELINRLHSVGWCVAALGDDCRMYASYLRAKRDPQFLDGGEIARLGYLPQTQSHYLKGERTTLLDVIGGFVKALNPFR